MALSGDAESFLPRIRCVFYAIFDQEQGPKVACQVPEGSIITPALTSPQSFATGSGVHGTDGSSLSSISLGALSSQRNGLTATSTPPRTSRGKGSSTVGLFEFESIVEYVIPKDQICGRLVRCNTPSHRIIGFPVKLTGARYRNGRHRHEFRYNLCFVFDRMADLSCYEPIVRKCGRVLLACEVRAISQTFTARWLFILETRVCSKNPGSYLLRIISTIFSPFWNSSMRTSIHTRRHPYQSTTSTRSNYKYSRSIPIHPKYKIGKSR